MTAGTPKFETLNAAMDWTRHNAVVYADGRLYAAQAGIGGSVFREHGTSRGWAVELLAKKLHRKFGKATP